MFLLDNYESCLFFSDLNIAVYDAGMFAKDQDDYEKAVDKVFNTLDLVCVRFSIFFPEGNITCLLYTSPSPRD